MEIPRAGDLVTVAGPGGERDGIVVTIPSPNKVIVAVTDATRGAVMRTFAPEALFERKRDGEHDEALRRLIRRTPTSSRGGSPGGGGPGRGGQAHNRSPAHRATGR
jgi:hypothetical protein